MQIGIRGRGAPTIFLFQRYLQSNNSSAAVGNVVVSVLSIVLHINLLIANPILTLTQRLTVISGKRALCFVVSETEQNWTVVSSCAFHESVIGPSAFYGSVNHKTNFESQCVFHTIIYVY